MCIRDRNGYAQHVPEYFARRQPALVPAARRSGLAMPSAELWAGALSLLLIHSESGCPHSALNAARLLDRLSDAPDVDDAVSYTHLDVYKRQESGQPEDPRPRRSRRNAAHGLHRRRRMDTLSLIHI